MAEAIAWRILVALDASRHDPAALEAATRLAARKRADMQALFVEDQGLFHLAELPFAVELNHAGEAGRSLDAGRVGRLLRGQIERLRQNLELTASQQRINISHRTVRGRYLAEALGAAQADVDVLFLCRAAECRASLGTVARRTPSARAAEHAAVCVVYDATPAARRALHVAAEIAAAGNGKLAVLLPAEREAQAAVWRQQAAASEDLRQVASQFIVIAPDRRNGLLGGLALDCCRLLVAGRDERSLQLTQAGAATCPVVLVS